MAAESSVRLRVDGKDAVSQLNRVNKAASVLQGTIGKLTAAFAGFGIAGAALKGLQEAEDAAAAVRTLGVDSVKLKRELAGVSQELKGQVSEVKLLAASYDVASAGFNTAAGASQILKAAALGAKGGLSDLDTVANATTSVLNAYGLSSDKASKLVDGFIQTQNDGKIVVAQYAAQIGRVAPTAAAAGVGINELNAAIAAVTATGVPVESTFAGIRQVIAAVIKPTSEAQKKAKELGLEFSTAAIRTKGFAGFLDDVIKKTGGSEVEISQLFGSVEALTALMPLVNDRLNKFNKALDNQENSAGAAADAAKEMGNTVSGQVERIINNVSNLARSFDEVFGPGLKDALGDVNRSMMAMIGFVRSIDGEAIKAAVSFGSFVVKVTLLQKAFVLLRQAAIVNFLAKAIPMLITANKQMVLLRFATIKLKAAMMGLKAALPFGLILVGIDLVIGKIIEQNRVQAEYNDLVKQGGKAALEAAQKELEARKLVLATKLEGLEGQGGRTAAGQRKSAQRELASIETKLGTIGGRIKEINAETSAAAAAAAAEAEKQLAAILAAQNAGGGAGGKFEMPGFSASGMDPGLASEEAFAKQVEKLAEGNMLLQARLEGNEREEQQRQSIADIIERSGFVDKERIESARQTLQTIFDQTTALENQATTQKKLEERQKKAGEAMKALYTDIGMTLKNSVVQGIKGAIDGTKSLRDVAINLLNDMMNKLIDFAVNAALFGVVPGGGLFGGLFKGVFGGGAAKGGPVSAGKSYVVGEKGPEMFTPSRSGTIIPNNQMGGDVNVNVSVDATGSSVEGNDTQANQLGAAIAAAVKHELIMQKRPGGLLS